MNIPKKLKIGAHRFTVEIRDIDGCGYTDRTKNIIVISDDLTDSQKGSTLIHEILHVINNELDHALLDAIAEQLYQVLEENHLYDRKPTKRSTARSSGRKRLRASHGSRQR